MASYCDRCDRWYGENPAIERMAEFPNGSIGWERAMLMWSGEPCECPEGPLPSIDEND